MLAYTMHSFNTLTFTYMVESEGKKMTSHEGNIFCRSKTFNRYCDRLQENHTYEMSKYILETSYGKPILFLGIISIMYSLKSFMNGSILHTYKKEKNKYLSRTYTEDCIFTVSGFWGLCIFFVAVLSVCICCCRMCCCRGHRRRPVQPLHNTYTTAVTATPTYVQPSAPPAPMPATSAAPSAPQSVYGAPPPSYGTVATVSVCKYIVFQKLMAPQLVQIVH